MYAITFNIDTNCRKDLHINDSLTDTYDCIRKFMEVNNFSWQQENVYYGNNKVDTVSCVLTIQSLAKRYPWFTACVKDIRMLRIEENTNLMPALESIL